MHTLRDGSSSNSSVQLKSPIYFENAINHVSNILDHFDSHGGLTLTFNRDIVEKVIGDLLFDVDDESIHLTRALALSVFKLHEDALPEDNATTLMCILSRSSLFSDMCLVKGPLSEEDIAEADLALSHVGREDYMVAYADALIFIRDQGLFVIVSLEALPDPDVANIVNSIANLFARLYSGINEVLDVRDSENIGSSAPLPPFLPHSRIKIPTAVLSELLPQYTQRLQRAGWTQLSRLHQDSAQQRPEREMPAPTPRTAALWLSTGSSR
ncbi:hypothetical protein PsorP6_014043 [Peronosclerospora sorghi]|uniref:Uncharacterized protein n=1 Tax=Peronosclerospora sorghi TaxID=230839 RepID=A0ACC0VGQ5_9STRA|nr:hypothetical protein PsorP6_014043 [Peronosclerospora sorghi]